jgi:hypothetical protein
VGFPVVTIRLLTSGTEGAVYVYLEDVDPDGAASYLTEGCPRFLHRRTTGAADPVMLGVSSNLRPLRRASRDSHGPHGIGRATAAHLGSHTQRPSDQARHCLGTMHPASSGTARPRRPSRSGSAPIHTSTFRFDTCERCRLPPTSSLCHDKLLTPPSPSCLPECVTLPESVEHRRLRPRQVR